MITIEQLLESVDLNFEPRWVTKDQNGYIILWGTKPRIIADGCWGNVGWRRGVSILKLAEFADKPWSECIYEVPRKTTGKIVKLPEFDRTEASIFHAERLYSVVNEIIDWINDNYKDSK